MLLVAAFVAVPLSYVLLHRWLQEFAYRIGMEWSYFMLAIAGLFIRTVVTVGHELVKASSANPVESLRYE